MLPRLTRQEGRVAASLHRCQGTPRDVQPEGGLKLTMVDRAGPLIKQDRPRQLARTRMGTQRVTRTSDQPVLRLNWVDGCPMDTDKRLHVGTCCHVHARPQQSTLWPWDRKSPDGTNRGGVVTAEPSVKPPHCFQPLLTGKQSQIRIAMTQSMVVCDPQAIFTTDTLRAATGSESAGSSHCKLQLTPKQETAPVLRCKA